MASAIAAVMAVSLLMPTSASASDAGATTAAPASVSTSTQPRASAAPGGFRPGNIISDQVFFNSGTMTAGQIDAFFRSKVSSCQPGYTCLKDYRQNTPNRPADIYCRGYSGAPGESAATIIFRVAQSCGVNPQVFIVMLQKEQSLVTHTWPSSWRYDMALGQGCPDTAPCDPQFAGFFYQIYGAARQMKIYTEGRYFNWYAPGKTWNILYHPNAGCGRGPVYVENSATAALYYYTPYQPNAASLRAGYGEGDSCSSYGNRNFYNYFTDWFGSTQGPANPTRGAIVAPGGDKIYLLMAGVRYHIASPDDLAPFTARFGPVSIVSTAFMNSLPEGKRITRFVHDPRTGTLYLLQPDGTKHRFANQEQVTRFGYPLDSYVNLDAATANAFDTGPDVNDYFRSGPSPEIYLYQGGAKRYIATAETWQILTGGAPTYVASMNPTTAAAVPPGPIVIPANSLVRTASQDPVYLTLLRDRLVHIPSIALASEFGPQGYTTVPDAALDANRRVSGVLSPIVECGSTRYLAASGTLSRIVGNDLGGITPLRLGPEECGAFSISSSTVSAPFFVQPRGKSEVYTITGNELRHVQSPSDLTALNGNRPLQILTWAPETASWFGIGSPFLLEGSFVTFQGRNEIYRYVKGSLHHVRSMATLVALGGGQAPRTQMLPADSFETFAVGSPILTSGADFVQFQGLPEIYRYENGALRHVQRMETLISLGGGRLPPILNLATAFKADYTVGTPIP